MAQRRGRERKNAVEVQLDPLTRFAADSPPRARLLQWEDVPTCVVRTSCHSQELNKLVLKFVIECEIPKVGTLEREQLKAAARSPIRRWPSWRRACSGSIPTSLRTGRSAVYLAEDERALREHAEISGFPATRMVEI
jgi:hypothetical protein